MGTKEKLANSYIEKTKEKYLNDNLSPERNAIITGYAIDNILGEIGSKIFYENKIDYSPAGLDNSTKISFGDNYFNNDLSIPGNDREFVKHVFNSRVNTDILIMGHAIMDLKWYEDYTEHEYEEIINTNLISYMNIARSFIHNTIDKKYKKYIIIIGSMAYDNVLNGSIPYMVSKAGTAMLARGLAWELAPKNYNVIAIHPSNTENAPMSSETIMKLSNFRNISLEDAHSYWSAVKPKNKFLTKCEIAEIVSLFVSGKCDSMSGANIELRGGQR